VTEERNAPTKKKTHKIGREWNISVKVAKGGEMAGERGGQNGKGELRAK